MRTITRQYDSANQLTEWTELVGLNITKPYTHTYSLTGNRTQTRETYTGQTTNYTYDQANRLTGYNGIGEYHYNGDGLRMNKSVNGADPLDAFGWDIVGGLPLLLFDSHYEYIYGPGGMVLEQVTSANSVSYLHGDQLGSIRLVTDAGGSIANSYEYDAYGARTETGPGTIASAFGYTGEYTDEESGLVYLRARYYDPSTQQFLSADTLLTGLPYAYANGNPINMVDPTGQFAWALPFVGAVAIPDVVVAVGAAILVPEVIVPALVVVVASVAVIYVADQISQNNQNQVNATAAAVATSAALQSQIASQSYSAAELQHQRDSCTVSSDSSEPIEVPIDDPGSVLGPRGYVENPHRPGSWGVLDDNGKFREKWRVDRATPGAPGYRGKDHVHHNGGKEHLDPKTPFIP